MLETIYWLALILGAAYLLLGAVIGDIFDAFDFDFGDGTSVLGVFMTTIAAFGAGGLLGRQIWGQSEGVSVVTGLVAGAVLGFLAYLFFRALARSEAEDAFSLDSLVGRVGRVVLAITPNGTGRVSVLHDGMTRMFTATSKKNLLVGETVVVDSTNGDVLNVTRVK